MLCAGYMRHLDNEIWAARQRERVASVAQQHRRWHRETLEKARAARSNGGEHARLMNTANVFRMYFTQTRLLKI